jgi:hypothetical protein
MVAKLLEYTPGARLSAIESMVHPFFDELRAEGARMPNGKEFPPLFDFTREGQQRLAHSSQLQSSRYHLRTDIIRLVPRRTLDPT